MKVVIEKLVDVDRVEKNGEASVMDCDNQRDLCMESYSHS